MRRFRRLGMALTIAAVGSLGLAAPAVADGGDTNGFWQYHSTHRTLAECDNAGRPFVPGVSDGWACSHWTPSGDTEGWNLYLVFGS